MKNNPRSHTKRLACDFVWFRGSFLRSPLKHTKRNQDATILSPLIYVSPDYDLISWFTPNAVAL